MDNLKKIAVPISQPHVLKKCFWPLIITRQHEFSLPCKAHII